MPSHSSAYDPGALRVRYVSHRAAGVTVLEKAKLPEGIIAEVIRSNYGVDVVDIEFLPIGNDATAWAYRVKAEHASFFLKLRYGRPNPAGLLVSQHLRRCGIENVVAPLSTISHAQYATLDEYTLLLFPWIDGTSGWNRKLTLGQYHDWGIIMRRVHNAPISAELEDTVPLEQFGKRWLDRLQRIHQVVARDEFDSEISEKMSRAWRQRAPEIELVRSRYLECAARFSFQKPDLVLCHADIHKANIMIDRVDAIQIFDWDEVILAPKERDLMFFIRDGQSAQETTAFLHGYGTKDIESMGLAYYRYDWVVQEFCDNGERLFFATNLSETDLAFAFDEFCRLFAEHDVVARAHQAYSDIS